MSAKNTAKHCSAISDFATTLLPHFIYLFKLYSSFHPYCWQGKRLYRWRSIALKDPFNLPHRVSDKNMERSRSVKAKTSSLVKIREMKWRNQAISSNSKNTSRLARNVWNRFFLKDTLKCSNAQYCYCCYHNWISNKEVGHDAWLVKQK